MHSLSLSFSHPTQCFVLTFKRLALSHAANEIGHGHIYIFIHGLVCWLQLLCSACLHLIILSSVHIKIKIIFNFFPLLWLHLTFSLRSRFSCSCCLSVCSLVMSMSVPFFSLASLFHPFYGFSFTLSIDSLVFGSFYSCSQHCSLFSMRIVLPICFFFSTFTHFFCWKYFICGAKYNGLNGERDDLIQNHRHFWPKKPTFQSFWIVLQSI